MVNRVGTATFSTEGATMSKSYEEMRKRFAFVAQQQDTQSQLAQAAKRADSTVDQLTRSRTPEPKALERRVSK